MKILRQKSIFENFNFKSLVVAYLVTINSYPLHYIIAVYFLNFLFLSITFNALITSILSLIATSISLIYYRRKYFITICGFHRIMDPKHKPHFEKWNPSWEIEFKNEKNRIENHLDHTLFDSHYPGIIHIGSTSIKDISLSTPMHDMGLFLNREINEKFIHQMEELGYDYIGAAPHDPDGYDNWFMKMNPDNMKGFDLHAVEPQGHENLKAIKIFAEYLSRFPKEREKYELYKRLSQEKGESFAIYKMGKQRIVQEIRKKACEWYIHQNEFKL